MTFSYYPVQRGYVFPRACWLVRDKIQPYLEPLYVCLIKQRAPDVLGEITKVANDDSFKHFIIEHQNKRKKNSSALDTAG